MIPAEENLTTREKLEQPSTHHVPAFMNYQEKYKGDILSEAFAVELSESFDIGNTRRMLCVRRVPEIQPFNPTKI
jgi:hypothetical protein